MDYLYFCFEISISADVVLYGANQFSNVSNK